MIRTADFGIALRVAAIAAGLALAHASGAAAQSQPLRPIASEHLKWNGDAKAPDISGVWVRSTTTGDAPDKEGWLPWPPPLKPNFAAIWHQRIAAAAAGTRTDDPVRACLPPGMPRFMTGMTGSLLIIQTPGRVMLYRDGSPVRRVWLDGRPLPSPRDLESFYNGNAAGHYEGSDLVTQVIGIKAQPIDSTGVPHSDDLKITERFHRVDSTTLRVEITLSDPTAYTSPMTSMTTYKMSKDPLWEPEEFLCKPETNFHPEAFVQ